MEALYAKACLEGNDNASVAQMEEVSEEKERPPLKFIGVVDETSISKRGKHLVMHFDGHKSGGSRSFPNFL